VADRLTKKGVEEFAAVAAEHVGDDKVPGLVALVACGEQTHVEALGSLSVGGPPVERDSLFRIASTTKPLTAATTLALVGEGQFELDEPVERLLPELSHPEVLRRMDGPLEDTVPTHRPITVRDLLTFTFGFGMALETFMAPEPWPIVTASEELHLCTLGPPDPQVQPDPDTWIAALGFLPLLAHPGERWLYNTGASVLGVLAARAAREPFADVLRTRVLEPLGMSDTSMWTTETERLATSYIPTDHGLEVGDPPDGAWSKQPAFGDAASGLVSTADDLLAFARMLLRGGSPVLSETAVEEMTSDQLTAEQKERDGHGVLFGRSWAFCQSVITHRPRRGAFGWDGGLGTSWLVDPSRDPAVIVLTQRMFESPEPPRVHTAIQDAAYRALR